MKKNRKKYIYKIIIFVIILIIICTVLILLNIKKMKDEENRQKYLARQTDYDEYYEGKIFPAGITRLKSLYNSSGGKLSQDIYYEQLNKTVNYLIKLNNTLSGKNINEIKQYYKENENEILDNIGKYDEKLFLETVDKLENITNDNLGVYKKSNIDIQSFVDAGNICIFNTNVEYTNAQIIFETYFYKNYNSNKGAVYFKVK